MAKPHKTDGKLSSTPLRARSRPLQRNESSDDRGTEPITVLEPETRARRRASGPRTAIGKQRSSLNAQKYGIFSKGLLVGDESPCEFKLLLKGLRDDLQPKGTLEPVLVENLAIILWRKRRVIGAESAEVDEAISYAAIDTLMAEIDEVWECSRSGESAGGMLRHHNNLHILRHAIEMLRTVRYGLKEFGFQKNPWLLRKLYGLDHDGAAPYGSVFQIYLNCSKRAEDSSTGNGGTDSAEELKRKMLNILDKEIERLQGFMAGSALINIERNQCKRAAALVPAPAVLERLLRYETHLSREFDRTLSQLERLQRLRLGQPVLPSIDVRLSR